MPDVIVVGAGPAGAIAALVLARAGATVRLFDRATFPRAKLCGDTVNPGALAILRRLGLGHAAERGLAIDGMLVTGPGSVQVHATYGSAQGRALSRREFDAALVAAAAAAGVAIEENVLVRAAIAGTHRDGPTVAGVILRRADGRSFREPARLVIAADGAHSRLARDLRLSRSSARPRRWAVGAYFHGVSEMTSLGEMHVRAGHYVGVAPLPAGLANACVVTDDRAKLRDARSLLMTTLRSDPQLASRFARATPIAPPVCMGPLGVDCDIPGMPGLLLAGDAAGFVDPMTGDGLHFALRGAELAAEAAIEWLEHGALDAHVRLGRARRREFSRKWRFNRTLRALVAAPFSVRLAERAAAVAPGVMRRVVLYAGDVLSPAVARVC